MFKVPTGCHPAATHPAKYNTGLGEAPPSASQRHLLTAYDHWPGRGAACVFCAYLASRENCQIGPILLSFVGEKMQIDKISTYSIRF